MRLGRSWCSQVAAVTSVIALFLCTWGSASAAARMHWTAPFEAPSPPGEGGHEFLETVSCPSTDLCVAAGRHGLAVSSDPASGLGSWSVITQPRSTDCTPQPSGACLPDGPPSIWPPVSINSISCPTSTLCVAGGVDSQQKFRCPRPTLCESVRTRQYTPAIFTSTDPGGGPEAWKETQLHGKSAIYSVSCATATECVALAKDGTLIGSSNPLGGASAWKTADLYPYEPVTYGQNAVACVAGGGLCVATGQSSSILWARNPLAGILSWRGVKLGRFPTLLGVACASPKLCVGYGFATLIASRNPAHGRWSRRGAPKHLPRGLALNAGSCAPSGFCAVAGGSGSNNGTVLTNAAPMRRAWRRARIDNVPIRSIACPSSGLCIAVDGSGRILTGT